MKSTRFFNSEVFEVLKECRDESQSLYYQTQDIGMAFEYAVSHNMLAMYVNQFVHSNPAYRTTQFTDSDCF